ncbi:MAG TPA: hypothetical protein VH497_13875 [Vicinamibacterales bacterium]|jgi:hypothetical protein
MSKRSRVSALAIAVGCLVWLPGAAAAQDQSPLAGAWTLNKSLSELPREIGFNLNWLPPTGDGAQQSGSSGGRGRRGSSGGNRSGGVPNYIPRESSEDARRLQFITGEARNPPTRLMIVDTPGAVTITNELGQSRTLHPSGKQESLEIQGVPFVATTARDGDQLVTVYSVEAGRTVRYTYSHNANPPQLVVEVQFLEKGAGDKAKRIYEPASATDTSSPSAPAQPGSPPAARPPGAPSGEPAQTSEQFDSRPGAELRGLTSLGVLVEDLGSQAVACGLNRDALENALAKRLTDGGLTVKKNSDEDTYVYVNVQTSSLPNGTCVSRYDAFLYTHGTARLSYRDQPVLVQISLIHRGSIGSSSAPGTHAAAVTHGLESYVDLFITQIRAANK